jgi:small-conductance mechanosensitive channel
MLSSQSLLALVGAVDSPSLTTVGFGVATLVAWFVLAVLIPKEHRGRLRLPLLMQGMWLIATVIWAAKFFAVATRDLFAVVSSVFGALALTRIGWLLVIDVFLQEGRRIGLSKLTRDLLHAVTLIIVAISAARAAGADAQALATTGGLVTAGLTFSLQQTLGDLVAGILLSARAPFEVGDWVAYDDDRQHVGRVVEINWRDTRLHTNDDVEVVVPNSTLARASILVLTRPRPISRRMVLFDVGYQHAPHDVVDAVREAINDPISGVLPTPAPDVILSSFEGSSGVIPILLKRPFGHRRLAAQAEAAWRDSSGC